MQLGWEGSQLDGGGKTGAALVTADMPPVSREEAGQSAFPGIRG